MSEPDIDIDAIQARLDRKEAVEAATPLCGTVMNVMDAAYVNDVAMRLREMRMVKNQNKVPRIVLDRDVVLLVRSDDPEQNTDDAEAIHYTKEYYFPQGATVSRVRGNRSIVRIDSADGAKYIQLRLEGSSRWRLIAKHGYCRPSGRRAASRVRGSSPDVEPSFNR